MINSPVKVMPALILDMDGTVRRTKSGSPFSKDPSDVELMPGMEDLMMLYRNNGFYIFGMSNQGGVAAGFKTQEAMLLEMRYTIELFKQNPFHMIQACLALGPSEGGTVFPYNFRSLLRKPQIGMLAQLEVDMVKKGVVVDWDKSLFVGDRNEDELCAKQAGIRYLHVDEFLATVHTFEGAEKQN